MHLALITNIFLLTQIDDLKAQLEGNLKVATRSSVKTKVLAPGISGTNRQTCLITLNKTKKDVIQVTIGNLDSGCSKHMTGNRSKLKNFMEKFIGTVRFGNDHFGAIMGYGDYVIASKRNLVRGLPRLRSFEKEHLCSTLSTWKKQEVSHKRKSENTNMEFLHTLHMDLCGLMRVQSINEEIHFSQQDTIQDSHGLGGIFAIKFCSKNSSTKRRCRKMKSYTCGSSTYNAVILKSTDVSMGRSFIGALWRCRGYPTNDSEELVKFQAKDDIVRIFTLGYAPTEGYKSTTKNLVD
ncbi:hypothetical protein Tco_0457918 [Tanacetum coccineum]